MNMGSHPAKDTKDNKVDMTSKELSARHAIPPPIPLAPLQDAFPQKPSARNTPMLSFQPHHIEISTEHPSVSGRLLLHIPKLAHKKFHFVSMALHLRLKESISWSRQDLITFEIEKRHWSQTVWEKKIILPLKDRQVDENTDESIENGTHFVAVVKEPSAKNGKNRIAITADEWRWEWLMPVTEREVRPESFEGVMGNVWYELEAKCLFRWDDVDQDGNVVQSISSATSAQEILEATYDPLAGQGSSRHGGTALLKGLEGPSKKAKSLANALGKLRVNTKNKKVQHAGDFKVGSQHDEYVKNSLQKRNNTMAADTHDNSNTNSSNNEELLSISSRGQSTPHLGAHPQETPLAPNGSNNGSEPLPFLVRKLLKLYFVKPPPSTLSNPSFFLPPPSMALPTLPGTRRLKAIIPGARIQVQIQIPSLIPIRGYAQTSQLIPDHKKGGLVSSKDSMQSSELQHMRQQQHQFHHHHHQHHQNHNGHGWEIDQQYLDSFQVALTVRKVTQKDIDSSDLLKKRYQNSGGPSSVSPFASSSSPSCSQNAFNVDTATGRKRLLATSLSSSSLADQYCHSGPDAGDRSRETTKAGAAAAGTGPGTSRPWRKEIRVRKVKCEFWQKESCRIPSEEPGSTPDIARTIKYTLGQPFSYSEKEQERERSRSSMQHSSAAHADLSQYGNSSHQPGSVSWDTTVVGGGSDHRSRAPLSPTLKDTNTSFSRHESPISSSPLQTPIIPYAEARRRGSNASSHYSPVLQPSVISTSFTHGPSPINQTPTASKPFMLLFPVLLDSPKLRQTFTWPSAETPAPVANQPFALGALPMPGVASTVDAEGDYPTPQALYQMALRGKVADQATGTGSGEAEDSEKDLVTGEITVDDSPPSSPLTGSPAGHHHYRGHNYLQNHAVLLASTRPRIEVKHYLSFRLSIDLLEFENEIEQDDGLDLGAVEEQQLQQARKRQELSAYRSNVGSPSTTPSLSPFGGAGDPASPRGSHSVTASPGGMAVPSLGRASAGTLTANTPAGANSTTVQPALSFLNSAAGLLDLEKDLQDDGAIRRARDLHSQRASRSNSASGLGLLQSPLTSPPQPLLGAAYDLDQRRGSNASQATMKSTISGNSHFQTMNVLSSGSGSGGLVAGAIGAIKEKASSSTLSAMMNVVTGGGGGGGSSSSDKGHSNHAGSSQSQYEIIGGHAHPAEAGSGPETAAATAEAGVATMSSSTSSSNPAHRRHRSGTVHVHKLKDFVIRVPITVFIQVDDLACVGTSSRGHVGGSSGTETGSGIRTVTGSATGTGTGTETISTSGDLYAGMGSIAEVEEDRKVGMRLDGEHRLMARVDSHDGVVGAGIGIGTGREQNDDDEQAEYLEGQFMGDHE
ncbi:hypothetical protein EDD11_004279 [Mortierella claussenii]|nr:hypothetical protein EDD11_004279 [Mortierella claussenii]